MQPREAALAAPAAAAPKPGRLLPWAPSLTLALLVGPVAAGLAGVLLPAFGWFPPLGGHGLSLAPWQALREWPGLWPSVRLSVVTGLLATVLSVGISLLIMAAAHGTRAMRLIERSLAPLLAVPHAAAAFGLAFLIAPSGWIVRALSPWATGFAVAPDWLIVGDPVGLSLVAGLVVKEVPFLMLMTLTALGQADATRGVALARSLGYGPVAAWCKAVLPRVYPQLRLPVLAVLAYSASVVDVAVVLGPVAPPPLAVQITRWSADPDLSQRFTAAAGAVLLLGLTLALLGLWRLGERIVAGVGLRWIEAGGRGRRDAAWRAAGLAVGALVGSALVMGLAGLAIWSIAGLWTFPDALPKAIRLDAWARALRDLGTPLRDTLWIGLAATGIGMGLAIGCLEAESRHGLGRPGRALWLLYLPLIVPQVAFLGGLQTFALVLGLDGMTGAVIAAHAVFVTPYVFLTLAEPWRTWDGRAALVAATLGAGPDAVLWRVRLPMLLRPVLAAAAVGFAVSASQYLPTLLMGGGRVTTLTTEAVALAAGGERRIIGVTALAQTAPPMAGFALALLVPALAFRNRRDLR